MAERQFTHKLFDEQPDFDVGGGNFSFQDTKLDEERATDWHREYTARRQAEELAKADLIQGLIDKRMAHVTTHLSICSQCQGTGVTYRDELIDYHRRDYATFEETCSHCKGVGSFFNKEVTMKVTISYPKQLGKAT